jgi:Domain of unknown function (DUF4276)
MNLYFLVEGSTESEFYPKFMQYYFDGKLNRIDSYADANANNYYLIGCDGYPYIFTGSQKPGYDVTALKSAIQEVNENPVYDYLILCLDADETSIAERTTEFQSYIEKYKKEGIILNEYCQFVIIVQNRCIETWFLGNKKMYSTNPNDERLISFSRYFNVKKKDPEQMGNYRPEYTHQDFHLQYLRAMLREKRKTYRKEDIVNTVATDEYIQELEKRIQGKENHLYSLADFIAFCKNIKDRLV